MREWLRRLTSGGGLAAVDMANDDDVDMNLLLTVGTTSAMSIALFASRLSMNRRWRRQIVHTP